MCRDCNSKCGLFVDAPFIKSWVLKGAAAFESLWYANLDLNSRSTLPPICWGVVADDLALGTELACEMWISACRGVILHVHPNLTERYINYSGGNPIGQKRTPGTAYFFNKATDMRWVALGLRSFRKSFSRQKRILANIVLANDEQHKIFGLKPSGEDQDFIQKIFSRYDETLSMPVSIAVQFGSDQRFLAKFALGLGFKLGGAAYLDSEFAHKLGAHLNEPDINKRPPIVAPVMLEGSPAGSRFHDMLSWRGGIVIYFSRLGNIAGVHLSIWGHHATIALSDRADIDLPNWCDSLGGNDAMFVVVPQTEYFSPVIRPVDFIAHCGGRAIHPDLKRAETGRLASLEDLPERNPGEDM